jgi:hypothetical protein
MPQLALITMHCKHLILQLLFVAHVVIAAGLQDLFLATEDEPGIVISLQTGLCHIKQKLYVDYVKDCQELGVSSVFGLKSGGHKQGLPLKDALNLLKADSCPLHNNKIQLLVLDNSGVSAATSPENGIKAYGKCQVHATR